MISSFKTEEEEETKVPPGAWRFGPAKLFYDRLGITTNPEQLDYGAVFQPNLEETDDDVDTPGPAAERDRLLEAAVASILPLEGGEESGTGSGGLVPGFQGQLSSRVAFLWVSIKQEDAGRDIPQSEVDQAAATLVQLMKEEDEARSCCNNKIDQAPDYLLGTMATPVQQSKNSDQDDFSLLAHNEWENDVVWFPEQVRTTAISNAREARAGWIPIATKRTCDHWYGEEGDFNSMFPHENEELISGSWEDEVIWDVDELRKSNPQPKIPVYETTNEHYVFDMPKDVPPVVVLDAPASGAVSKKKGQSHSIKSKQLLGRAGLLLKEGPFQLEPSKKIQETVIREPITVSTVSKSESSSFSIRGDCYNSFFNISNDKSYQSDKDNAAVLELVRLGDISIRHSKLVTSLTPPFIKPYLNLEELRNFHRPQLTAGNNAPLMRNRLNRHLIRSATPRIQKKAVEWNKLIAQECPIMLDQPIDLSARDGDILLVENCEEFPPLLSEVGMCSKITNYCQRASSMTLEERGNIPITPHPYGRSTVVQALPTPYLGRLGAGQILSSLENNLYCSPIYYHEPRSTDFLVTRTRAGYLIREFNASFTAGQQCPLLEVPEPNSVKARGFLKDLVQVFIFRKFTKCSGGPRQVNLDEITRSFPTVFESNIKTWLKSAADLKKKGNSTWVVMKPEFTLPPEAELEKMVTPEQCCAYFTMLAAEQRLKDAGCDSMLSLPELADGDKSEKTKKSEEESIGIEIRRDKNRSKLEEELKAAPWNTTSAFIAASKGKCLLQIVGPADPTGCGEGFSYIRVSKGVTQPEAGGRKLKSTTSPPPRLGGSTGDLRRLSTKTAKEILRKSGVPEQEIQKLTRWEIIDVVRTLCTEKARQGDIDDKGISKYSRWKNKTERVLNQERYEEDCQRVFELQNKLLSSAEVLSTDNDDDDEDDDKDDKNWTTQGDIDLMGENIERILSSDENTKPETTQSHEAEERERVQLQFLMLGKVKAEDAEIIRKEKERLAATSAAELEKKKLEVNILNDLLAHPGRVLKIERMYEGKGGAKYTRTEIVRDPLVIAAYVKIRKTKNEQFIKAFMRKVAAKERKEQKQNEKEMASKLKAKQELIERKLEGRRRRRKSEMDLDEEYIPNSRSMKNTGKKITKRKRRCGRCGLEGHMRTSHECPMFNSEKSPASGSESESSDEFSEDDNKLEVTNGTDDINIMKSLPSSSSKITQNGNRAVEDHYEHGKENEEQNGTVVKLDGLKMVLKVPKESVAKAQMLEGKGKELATEAYSTFTESASSRSPLRRRFSQAERENADYLVGFRTTAADRSARKDRSVED